MMKWVRPVTSGRPPTPRGQHNAVVLGQKMYIIGGINKDTIFNDVYTLDLDTFTWEKANANGALPPTHPYEARHFRVHSGHGHAVLHGTKIYMIADNQHLYCFETLTSKWSRFLLETEKIPQRSLYNVVNYKNRAFLLVGTALGKLLNMAEFDIDPVFEQPSFPNPFVPEIFTLFNNPIFSDFTLVIKNEDGTENTLLAHKNVLYARSNYFKSVFTSGMSESHTNILRIDYATYPVVFAFFALCIFWGAGGG